MSVEAPLLDTDDTKCTVRQLLGDLEARLMIEGTDRCHNAVMHVRDRIFNLSTSSTEGARRTRRDIDALRALTRKYDCKVDTATLVEPIVMVISSSYTPVQGYDERVVDIPVLFSGAGDHDMDWMCNTSTGEELGRAIADRSFDVIQHLLPLPADGDSWDGCFETSHLVTPKDKAWESTLAKIRLAVWPFSVAPAGAAKVDDDGDEKRALSYMAFE